MESTMHPHPPCMYVVFEIVKTFIFREGGGGRRGRESAEECRGKSSPGQD